MIIVVCPISKIGATVATEWFCADSGICDCGGCHQKIINIKLKWPLKHHKMIQMNPDLNAVQ